MYSIAQHRFKSWLLFSYKRAQNNYEDIPETESFEKIRMKAKSEEEEDTVADDVE